MTDEPPPLPPVIEGTVVDRLVNARRQPVVPAWIRDDVTRRAAARYAVLHVSHLAAFHAARTPKYAVKTAWHAPRGLFRAAVFTAGWVFDADAAPLRRDAVAKRDHAAYAKLDKLRAAKIRVRGMVAVAVPAAALIAVLVADALLWPLAWLPVAVVAFVMLGYLGRPLDRVWLDTPVVDTRAERLTPDIVLRALTSLGIAKMSKNEDFGPSPFAAPVARDGPGWRADVNLPYGVTPADVTERRDKLASGLRRPLGCVWPEPDDTEHGGRLILWVGDRDLSKAGNIAWPLARSGTADVFQPVPFGIDPRGRAVTVPLIYHNVLIGSIMRQGKTAAVRVLACAGALDATCALWLHELKGTGDLDPLEQVSHRFVSGIDDLSVGYTAESLALLRTEVMTRVASFKKLPRDLVPDKKVTREVASKRSLGLHPLMCVIDECQNLFGHKEFGQQAGDDAEFIIRIGPALGVMLVLATQRPDKDSLPTGISSLVSVRFCLKVMDQVANDMILGTSAYKNGIRATTFRPEIDAGNGMLLAAKGPQVVRTCYLDTPATERVAVRARALRLAAGTLTGVAAGEAPERAGPSVLEDVMAVLGGEKAHSQVIVGRLAELRPGAYGHLTALTPEAQASWLAAQLSAFGLRTEQVWLEGRNLMGVTRKSVLAALESKGASH